MTATLPDATAATVTSRRVVGASVPRRDGRTHVTGSTAFMEDRTFPGMLHLRMVRSPLPHARLGAIDLSAAQRVPGYVAALTAADVPKNVYTILCLIGVEPDEEKVLATERVRYIGEPIVAVLGASEEAAAEAADAVHVELEELPAVFDVEEALAPGAPIVTHWGANHFVYEGHHARRVRLGDVDAALAAADHVVEGRYQLSPIEHAPVETTGCIVNPEGDGRYTVYTNTQAIFFSLDNAALILDVPPAALHFVGGTVGGGFGGKVDVVTEPIATLAAMRTGKPVRYRYTRQEEMQVSSTRSGVRLYLTDGVMADGTLVARRASVYEDSGAYSRHTPYGCTKNAANLAGPYRIPNAAFDVHCVYTNRPPSSAMRGFGVTEASFSVESQMDRDAEAVGMDPLEFRLRNAYRDGDLKPHRKPVADASAIEVLQAAAALMGRDLPPELAALTSEPREVRP